MTFIDQLIIGFDTALRTSTGNTSSSHRPSPASGPDTTALSHEQQQLSGRLMRVNHCGEVCAQALYHGQALTAKSGRVSNAMLKAAEEETDHLVWCESRLKELNTETSKLNPLWYASSFAMGAVTGLLGDKINLGFVAATEEQVCKHLDEHLERLPEEDQRSRAILSAMREDEKRHEETALEKGGARYPGPIKNLMTGVSKAMTRSSFWI
ncbi:MAG: 2-polyprenyl-3-methyl-6-methoxy-1,4-benzoquinone monooxygenase [Pseudomonadales bacterium]